MKSRVKLMCVLLGSSALAALGQQALPPSPLCMAEYDKSCAELYADTTRVCDNNGVMEDCGDIILIHGSYKSVRKAAAHEAGGDAVSTNCGYGINGYVWRFACVGAGDGPKRCESQGGSEVGPCPNRCVAGNACQGVVG